MEVTLRSKTKRVKEKVVRDHYWYDPETKQRLHGRGGEMIFVYDPTSRRSIPRIVDREEWTNKNTYDDILEWAETYGANIVSRAPRFHVIIEVNPLELSELEEDLYRHGIQCDYEDQQSTSPG